MTYQAKGMLITLTDKTLTKAKEVGDGRNGQNRNSADKPYYDRTLMQDDETASFAAAAAEAAVAQALNLEWHAKVWPASEHYLHRDEPDVGRNVEVRRIREPNNGLVVREKDLGKRKVIVLAYPIPETGFKEVDVIGWLPAARAWEEGDEYREQSRRVPQSKLRKMEEAL